MRSFKLVTAVALSTMAFATVVAAHQNLAAKAHVSMPEARTLALKTFPGKVVTQELEKESGGSGLRYSFDIRAGGVTHEVGIDAKDGKLLENSIDNGKD